MIHNRQQILNHLAQKEKAIAEKLGLPSFRSGAHVLRDHRGWRQDEISVEYIWLVEMSRSLVGWGGLAGVKFKEHTFRDKHHSQQLVHAIFRTNSGDGINSFYQETAGNLVDNVMAGFQPDLFNATNGIALDGVSYTIHILSHSIDTVITVYNPNTPAWKKWESDVWTLGKALAGKSCDKESVELFS